MIQSKVSKDFNNNAFNEQDNMRIYGIKNHLCGDL